MIKQQDKIIACIMAIPEGKVSSYGQIAKLAGIPRGHRVVARFLKEQDVNPQLPWYRVVRADGKVGFPTGSRMHHKQTQQLLSEGVLLRNNIIDMNKYGWQPDLDFLLFHPDL